uniref:ependymin-like n=1 Tax=Pristiophorus japonicus TaxID=55135 RepID=UPI00398F2E8A
MKLVAALSVCSLFFVLAEGDQPQPCNTPPLLEGEMAVLHLIKNNGWIGRFAYDSIGKRMYFDRSSFGMNRTLNELNILLFNESVGYRFYPDNRTCVKYPLLVPFTKFSIPRNATFGGKVYLGTSSVPAAGLLVSFWRSKVHGEFSQLTVTESGCVPVSELSNTKELGWVIESYFNLSLGISDPNVFVPPPECSHLNLNL